MLALDFRFAEGERPWQAFNLGNGSGFSVREVVEVSRKVTGQPIPVQEMARRPGDPAVLVANARRAGELLGWTPRYRDLEPIIRSAWEWRRRNPNGYTVST